MPRKARLTIVFILDLFMLHIKLLEFISEIDEEITLLRVVTIAVNDNVKVYQKIIQKYTTSTECCKGTKSLLYITYC